MRRRVCVGVIVLGAAFLGVLGSASAFAWSAGSGVASTPPMGWNSWNAYQCTENAQDIEANALFIHDSGLQRDGYTYVNNDGCWNDLVGLGTADPSGFPISGTLPAESCGVVNGRLPDGEIFINPVEFPPSAPCANDGFKRVARYIHSLGLKFGLYLNASNNWNCEEIPGSYGFDAIDARTLVAWGVDFLKVDWGCSAATAPPGSNGPAGYSGIDAGPGNTPFGGPTFGDQPPPNQFTQQYATDPAAVQQTMYSALADAVRATGRPIVFSVAGAGTVDPQDWGLQIGNMARPAGDSAPTFASLVGIVNTDDQYDSLSHPGHWIDPDIMEVGNGMSQTEDQSEMSMFAEMADPLLMSTNMCASDCGSPSVAARPAQLAYDVSIFGNRRVIGVDQDRLGKAGRIVSFDGSHLIMARPLSNGDVAVTLFNEGGTPAVMSTTAAAAGLPAAPVYALRDLWSGRVTESAGAISAFVAPHQTVMYRISAPRNRGQVFEDLRLPADVTLVTTPSTTQAGPGSGMTTTVSLTNNAALPIWLRGLDVSAPAGWAVAPRARATGLVAAHGGAVSETFSVTPGAASAPITTSILTGIAGLAGPRREHVESSVTVLLVSPVSGRLATADTTGGPAAVFGQLDGAFAIDAAGTGVNAASRRGSATDQYGAIYEPAAADTAATAVVQITRAASTRGVEAGLMMRNSASGGGPEGVVLYLNGQTGAVVLAWNGTAGSGTVTSSVTSSGVPGAGTWLELTRTGANTYTGAYGPSPSGPWTTVGKATVTAAAANPVQDAGMFASSGSAGIADEADFAGFGVTG
jgi:hypothetical protein